MTKYTIAILCLCLPLIGCVSQTGFKSAGPTQAWTGKALIYDCKYTSQPPRFSRMRPVGQARAKD